MARFPWITTLSFSFALALSACGAADETTLESAPQGDAAPALDGDGSSAPELGALEQPLRRGSGGATRTGYTCSGLECSCTGDADCNDMFSDGVCGDIASCDDTDPLNPTCKCLILRIKQPVKSVVAQPAQVFQAVR